MTNDPAFLLTGATGFLGRRLLKRLFQDGARVIVLGRGERGAEAASAEERVLSLVEGCAPNRDQVAVIDADIAQLEALARQITDHLRRWRATPLVAVNVAAWLKMDFPGQHPAKRQATRLLNHRTNVLGLEQLLLALDHVDAASRNSLPVVQSLVHFSTCCAHGRRAGAIPQATIDPVAETENSYEQTKREGEFRVECWQAHRANRIPMTVIRPSIVTGPDTSDGYLAWLEVLSEPVELRDLPPWKRWLTGLRGSSVRRVDVLAGVARRLHLPLLPLLGNGDGVLDLIDAGDVEHYSWLAIRRHRREARRGRA